MVLWWWPYSVRLLKCPLGELLLYNMADMALQFFMDIEKKGGRQPRRGEFDSTLD